MVNLEELTRKEGITRVDLLGLNYCEDADHQVKRCDIYGVKGVCPRTCSYAQQMKEQERESEV